MGRNRRGGRGDEKEKNLRGEMGWERIGGREGRGMNRKRKRVG